MADSADTQALSAALKARAEAFAERAHLPWDLRQELSALLQEARGAPPPPRRPHLEMPTEPIQVAPRPVDPAAIGPAPPVEATAPTADSGDAGAPTLRQVGPTPRPDLPPRYEDRGIIGLGGMGEVRRVFDGALQRKVAMKLLLPHLVEKPRLRARFLEEAQVTAQLQHPGMIPVFDVGQLQDGRVYFTMQEVSGRNLRDIIVELHGAIRGARWLPTEDGWTFRRVIDTFRRVCEAVAYAHARGVVHRDLKPSNIMVGTFGEVLLMDWGVAKVLGEVPETTEGIPPLAEDWEDLSVVQTSRQRTGDELTRAGTNPGTLAYMAPEQALGVVDEIGPAVDVYALGAILYAILGGRPPFVGATPKEVRAAMAAGPPPKLEALLGARYQGLAPEPLRQICRDCMRAVPRARPANAQEVAEAVGKWLEGAQRRERAITLLKEADPLRDRVAELRTRADRLLKEAEARLQQTQGYAPIEEKRPAWDLEDRASALTLTAAIQEAAYLEGLRGALAHEPDLPEAHSRLADHYHRVHRLAEARGDLPGAAQAEAFLKAHDGRGHYKDYLLGHGSLTLRTAPAGVQAYLYAYRAEERRLVPRFLQHLGETPLVDRSLPRGSYLVKLRGPGLAEVSYPVNIQRGERWRVGPPRTWEGVETGPEPEDVLSIPPVDAVAEGECFVPPGPAILGGDDLGYQPMPRMRVWVGGFIIAKHPVTNRDYLAFLSHLLATGQREAAFAHVPRERPGSAGQSGGMIYGFSEGRGFYLQPDADGDTWLPDYPVVYVDWHSARAYAAWVAEMTGLPWRLPWEVEWEKAGRGADGRTYPWGDHVDPTWACIRPSHRGRPTPVVVDAYPVDESPYGVRGLGGNVMDWCLDAFAPVPAGVGEGGIFTPPADPSGDPPDTPRVYRGGAWYAPEKIARLSNRPTDPATWRGAHLGFRLARTWE